MRRETLDVKLFISRKEKLRYSSLDNLHNVFLLQWNENSINYKDIYRCLYSIQFFLKSWLNGIIALKYTIGSLLFNPEVGSTNHKAEPTTSCHKKGTITSRSWRESYVESKSGNENQAWNACGAWCCFSRKVFIIIINNIF